MPGREDETDDLVGNEPDPRFPSGPWVGYFLQRTGRPGKHWMEMDLTFRAGVISGAGRDLVGKFVFRGAYSTEDGKCSLVKNYIGLHAVNYAGYNEGRGIYGGWSIPTDGLHGGFLVWPKGMRLGPDDGSLAEEEPLEMAVPALVSGEEELHFWTSGPDRP
jgi:hypothetical protein